GFSFSSSGGGFRCRSCSFAEFQGPSRSSCSREQSQRWAAGDAAAEPGWRSSRALEICPCPSLGARECSRSCSCFLGQPGAACRPQ
ncbi:hypothetical protein Nmel_005266, partial [Mimus melanotis]